VNKLLLHKFESPRALIVLALSMVGLTGCGENIFETKWTEPDVDTVVVYSLARPELNLPAAFDFVARRTVEIEAPGVTGSWDLVLDTQDGELMFFPPGALDIESEARVLKLPDTAFDDVVKAPKDTTLYSRDMPVSVEENSVYVVRTHQGPNRFGVLCYYFGKLRPVEIDEASGSVKFEYDVSTLCDDRRLVPVPE
jgi:hypothetical protein